MTFWKSAWQLSACARAPPVVAAQTVRATAATAKDRTQTLVANIIVNHQPLVEQAGILSDFNAAVKPEPKPKIKASVRR
jgi:hypothetical protein